MRDGENHRSKAALQLRFTYWSLAVFEEFHHLAHEPDGVINAEGTIMNTVCVLAVSWLFHSGGGF